MNNDMKQLRDKATAFLAKEEKEFTSTVVLSADKTIYIPSTNNRAKRNKKIPKRFDDCVRDDQPIVSPLTFTCNKFDLYTNTLPKQNHKSEVVPEIIPKASILAVAEHMRNANVY